MRISSQRLRLELRRASAPLVAWIAIAVCGIAALGWVMSNQNTEHPWGDYITVKARFSDVKGVLPGKQEVRIAGVRVGIIRDAQVVDGDPVLELAVEKKYAPIYRNAHARLRSQTALEDKYVILTRGTPTAGALLPDDVLSGAQTTTPVDVSRILQSFDADVRHNLRFMLAGFGRGLGDGGAGLRDAFRELVPFLAVTRDVSHELAVRRERLADLVTKTGELTRSIGQHDRAISELIRTGNNTLTTLGRGDTRLGETLGALPGALDSIDRGLTTFGRLRAELDPALVSLRPTAKTLAPAMDALTQAADDLRPAALALAPTVRSLRPLATNLRPVADDVASIASSLRGQVPDVDIATRQLDACKTAFTDFFTNTLSMFKMDAAGQALGRGEVTVGPPITDTRRGPRPEDVGKARPQAVPGVSLGLKRLPTCTDAAGVSTFSGPRGGAR